MEDLKAALAKAHGLCQRVALLEQKKKRIIMPKQGRNFNNKSLSEDMYSAYRGETDQKRPTSPKDFAARSPIEGNKEHQVQAESSQGHAASDTHLDSEKLASNEEQRDKIAHSEAGSGSASGGEMKGGVLRMDSKTYDEIKKFLQKRYEATEQETIRDGKRERGSSKEIAPASQGASQDVREKLLRQNSSLTDSPRDPSYLVERVRALEHDACNKEHLFVTKMQEYRSLTKEIIQLRKRRATLKRAYQSSMVEMKRLKSKIQKQEQNIH
jgi:hypothetical protein